MRGGTLYQRKAAAARVRHRAPQPATYSRETIFARWGYACCYCDARAEHLDHVVPISKGGADAEHNLVPSCAACNLDKGAQLLADWAPIRPPSL